MRNGGQVRTVGLAERSKGQKSKEIRPLPSEETARVSVHNYWPMLKLQPQQPTTKKQVCVNVEKVTAVAPDGAAVG
ncbi:hypothetical protein K2173_011021 [Erythroxylum novogranatense]|uniref:Uncharacterized protein n=1 Tax=Erythroxylum novogranatense TaxID=1862640 RepID=A0AAV8T0A4_9ROSI|nr:hypothetical protein K2173_011021 [Erythroxylum novogranatense]